MKNDYTHISIVLDRSGSMENVKNDTIGGFNQFLKDQKNAPGEATITVVQFDNIWEPLYQSVPISNAKELTTSTFVPRGSTALLDAIGRTINLTGQFLESLSDDERPSRVIFVIITDGEENDSQEFSKERVQNMIQLQTDTYNWQFVFLGADQDAISSAAEVGIGAGAAMPYAGNSEGMRAAYSAISENLCAVRSGNATSMNFSNFQRCIQVDAGLNVKYGNLPDINPDTKTRLQDK